LGLLATQVVSEAFGGKKKDERNESGRQISGAAEAKKLGAYMLKGPQWVSLLLDEALKGGNGTKRLALEALAQLQHLLPKGEGGVVISGGAMLEELALRPYLQRLENEEFNSLMGEGLSLSELACPPSILRRFSSIFRTGCGFISDVLTDPEGGMVSKVLAATLIHEVLRVDLDVLHAGLGDELALLGVPESLLSLFFGHVWSNILHSKVHGIALLALKSDASQPFATKLFGGPHGLVARILEHHAAAESAIPVGYSSTLAALSIEIDEALEVAVRSTRSPGEDFGSPLESGSLNEVYREVANDLFLWRDVVESAMESTREGIYIGKQRGSSLDALKIRVSSPGSEYILAAKDTPNKTSNKGEGQTPGDSPLPKSKLLQALDGGLVSPGRRGDRVPLEVSLELDFGAPGFSPASTQSHTPRPIRSGTLGGGGGEGLTPRPKGYQTPMHRAGEPLNRTVRDKGRVISPVAFRKF